MTSSCAVVQDTKLHFQFFLQHKCCFSDKEHNTLFVRLCKEGLLYSENKLVRDSINHQPENRQNKKTKKIQKEGESQHKIDFRLSQALRGITRYKLVRLHADLLWMKFIICFSLLTELLSLSKFNCS